MVLEKVISMLILATILFDYCCCNDRNSIKGAKLFRITPEDSTQLNILQTLAENAGTELDFWTKPTRTFKPVDIVVDAKYQPEFEAKLTRNGVRNFTVVVQDLSRLLAQNENRILLKSFGITKIWREANVFGLSEEQKANQPLYSQYRTASGFALSQYHSHKEINTCLRNLASNAPSITEIVSLGKTYEGRDLLAIKIGTKVSRRSWSQRSAAKNAIFIDGGIHAREWISPATAVFIIHKMVNEYGSNPTIKSLVDAVDWYILPVVNPDGYDYSRRGGDKRMWRKTRSATRCGFWQRISGQCCQGVDPNRNFDFAYGTTDASTNSCSETYRGTGAFSEPETRALSNFLLNHSNNIKAYITMHSYGQQWLVPYGHKKGAYPTDYNELLELARSAANAVEKLHGTRYTVGNTANVIYAASGGSDDWAKGVANIKYVYTIELPPREGQGTGFVMSPSLIVQTGEEMFEGFKVVAEAVRILRK